MQMQTIIVFPDHLHAEMQSPNGTMKALSVTPGRRFYGAA